jgi:hypothetical protein
MRCEFHVCVLFPLQSYLQGVVMATSKRTSATSSTTRSKKAATPQAQENTTIQQSRKQSNGSVEEIIRYRAYQLYVQRGGTHGYDKEDWLRAESEVVSDESAHRV